MDVKHVADLASLPLKPADEKKIQRQFDQTLKYIDIINELNTADISPTSQVTGLKNVTRKDQIDPQRVLTPKQALSQAVHVHGDYFVVPAIFNEK